MKFEGPRQAQGFISQSSMIEDTFEIIYSGPRDKPNSLTLEFSDERLDWTRSYASHDYLGSNVALFDEFRQESGQLFGVTRRSQVLRECAYRLDVAQRVTREGAFSVSADGLPYEIGDVYRLSHDLPGWGQSGRITEQDSTTSVKLNRPITLEADKAYVFRVRAAETGQMLSADVTQLPGTYALGASIQIEPLPDGYVPALNDTFTVEPEGEDRLIAITSASLQTDLSRETSWVQYVPDISDDPGEVSATSQPVTQALSPAPDTIPGDVVAAQAQPLLARFSRGLNRLAAVSWQHDSTTLASVAGTNVYALDSEGNAPELVASVQGDANTTQFDLSRFDEGEALQLAIQPFTKSGMRRAVRSCASIPFAAE